MTKGVMGVELSDRTATTCLHSGRAVGLGLTVTLLSVCVGVSDSDEDTLTVSNVLDWSLDCERRLLVADSLRVSVKFLVSDRTVWLLDALMLIMSGVGETLRVAVGLRLVGLSVP